MNENKPSRWRSRLMGAAAGVLIVLLIAPASRWLTLAQFRLALPTTTALAPLGINGVLSTGYGRRVDFIARAQQAEAQHSPDDFPVQLAAAIATAPANIPYGKVGLLRTLEPRFGDRPSLYANILRIATLGPVRIHRDDEENEFSGIHPQGRKAPDWHCDPTQLALFDQDAAAGERLDPDNSYFPFMRAIGLFSAHRDDEALAAIHRAAGETQWREYYDDEIRGEWRLQDRTFGNRSALVHTLTSAAILFPHYSGLRAVVRMAMYHAVKQEQAGHIEEGLAIRRDVMRCGHAMVLQADSLIGMLVGIALDQISISRPGGKLSADSTTPINEAKRKAQKAQHLRAYDDYLRQIGHPEEIGPVHTVLEMDDRARELTGHNMSLLPFDHSLPQLMHWWMADLIVLSNVVWLLALGGTAALLMRSRRLQTGQPLPDNARRVLPFGLVAGAFVAPNTLTWVSPLFWHIDAGARWNFCLFGLLLAGLPLVLPVAEKTERLRRLGIFAAGLMAGMLFTGFLIWQVSGSLALSELYQALFNMSGYEEGTSVATGVNPSPFLTVLAPILTLLSLAVVSRLCRVPLSVGLVRGLKGVALPLAGLLFLVYGGMLLFTLRAESALQYGLDRVTQNETRYMAELAGEPWPVQTR